MGQILDILRGSHDVEKIIVDFDSMDFIVFVFVFPLFLSGNPLPSFPRSLALSCWALVLRQLTSLPCLDATPSDDEMQLWNTLNDVLKDAPSLLQRLIDYKGCEDNIRKVLCFFSLLLLRLLLLQALKQKLLLGKLQSLLQMNLRTSTSIQASQKVFSLISLSRFVLRTLSIIWLISKLLLSNQVMSLTSSSALMMLRWLILLSKTISLIIVVLLVV